eukprot:4482762-Alexandrium_andersonii.AAC.1
MSWWTDWGGNQQHNSNYGVPSWNPQSSHSWNDHGGKGTWGTGYNQDSYYNKGKGKGYGGGYKGNQN